MTVTISKGTDWPVCLEATYLILPKYVEETKYLVLYHVLETDSVGKSDLGIQFGLYL